MRFLLSQNTESSLQKADEILSKTNSDSPELLVLLAETAVKLNKFKTAKRALKTYFGSERSKNRNQFYVRALFATVYPSPIVRIIFEIERKLRVSRMAPTYTGRRSAKNSLIDSTRFPASTLATSVRGVRDSILSFIYSYHIHSS